MGFASAYLEERALFPILIKELPSQNTGIIVVIPSFDETQITDLLDSLALCDRPDCGVEIMIIINAPAGASIESISNNRESIARVEDWKKEHPQCFFKLFLIDVTEIEPEGWGVGLARKTGMDEAVRRYDLLNKSDGIILSLDADCRVRSNYFAAVFAEMNGQKYRSACSIYFEHPLSGDEFIPDVYRSITLYELHLRYFYQGLIYCGFPYVHHTVGSTIAVKAITYVKAGGMNRRMAGEDFYFIQKLLPSGGYFNLNSTTVYPSPRFSLRVPFGTGMTVTKIAEPGNKTFFTYNFKSFGELRKLFNMIDNIFLRDRDFAWYELPKSIKLFISKEEWILKISEIKRNTSGIGPFRKRFFSWFNMFRIVKYMNSAHISVFKKSPVQESALELLAASGHEFKSGNEAELLRYFRSLELGS